VGPHPANKSAFDRSGEILAVASDDGEVKVWNLIDGEQVCELKGHTDSVHAVAFDPFGKYVVTASSDNTFRLYGTLG
jgi:WD40 repeat protein